MASLRESMIERLLSLTEENLQSDYNPPSQKVIKTKLNKLERLLKEMSDQELFDEFVAEIESSAYSRGVNVAKECHWQRSLDQ